ncbi:MAG: hypothetical protein U0931_11720 [Vulcanimicrobiota bacterium]
MAYFISLWYNFTICLCLTYLGLSWVQIVPGYQVALMIAGLWIVPGQLLAILSFNRAKKSQGTVGFPVSSVALFLLAFLHFTTLPRGDMSIQPEWIQARFFAGFLLAFYSIQRGLLKAARYF